MNPFTHRHPTSVGMVLLLMLILTASCGGKPSEEGRATGSSQMIRTVSDADHFRDIVRDAGGRLLVFDFYADWCQPCKLLAPILDKLADQYQDRASFYKIDVDRNQELAGAVGMQGIPYVLFVQNGVSVEAFVGLHPKDAYARVIERHAEPTLAEPPVDTPDGELVEGVRVVRRPSAAVLDDIYVYRGETVRLVFEDIHFPYGVHIPAFGISSEASGLELAVTFKANDIGVFPIFCNGDCPTGAGAQYGRIVVMQLRASGNARYAELSAAQARDMIRSADPLILDVRTPGEYYGGFIQGAKLIPLQQLEARLGEIADHKDRDVLLYCRSGNRSTVAAEILMRNGFNRLHNLRHGIVEWDRMGYSKNP